MGLGNCLHSHILILILVIWSSSRVLTDDGDDDDPDHTDCHDHRKITPTLTVAISAELTLDFVNIRCNRENTVFEVKYKNNSYCVCGQLPRASSSYMYFECREKLNQYVDLLASVNKLQSDNDMCNFTLNFFKFEDGVKKKTRIPAKLHFKSAVKATTSSTVTSSIVTNTVLSVATSSRIVTSASSSVVILSKFQNMSSSIVKPSMVLSSLATNTLPPSYRSPTSVLLTTPFSVNSTMVHKNMISATLQISPTTSFAMVTSSSLSPDKEKEIKYKQDLNYINEVNVSSVNIEDKKTIDRVLDAATNLIGSNRTNKSEEDSGMKAVQVLQNLGEVISQQLDLGNHSQVIFQEVTENLVFGAAVINTSMVSEFSFPENDNNKIGDEKIDVPQTAFSNNSDKAFFVGIIFNGVRDMRENTGYGFIIGSRVINAKITPKPPSTLKDPVEMIFEKTIGVKSFQEDCSFFIEDSSKTAEHGRWSTRQCYEVFQNDTHIRCACFHFTNFAVLFKITNEEISEEDSYRLQIITYVGLSLSIFGCFLTFIIYLSLRNIKSDRSTIHKNLVLALGVADILFLVTVVIKPVKDTCIVLAMLTFYFYLSVFFWMFVEGVYIYLMVIKVFRGNVKRRRRLAYLVGWGCPLIIAVVTWAILREDVASQYHCWLSVDSGAIWAFVGPGLLIILVNFIILIAVMRTTWATFVDDKEYGGLKSATKTFAAVIPILGITWVFGVMAFNESSIVFQYIFAITNSIQGFIIFILYCLVNAEVRNEMKRKIVVWQTRRDVSSSTGRRPTYIISSEKNTTFNRTTQSQQATPNLAHAGQLVDNNTEGEPYITKNYTFEAEVDKEGFELGIKPSIPKDKDCDSNNKSDVGFV